MIEYLGVLYTFGKAAYGYYKDGKEYFDTTAVRLKVEQDQLVSAVGLFGLGVIGLQGA